MAKSGGRRPREKHPVIQRFPGSAPSGYLLGESPEKIFPIKERAKFSIRAEFFNVLNQDLALGNPSTSSPGNPLTYQNGLITGGFGTMNYTGLTSNSVNSTLPTPRTGQLVARFDF